MAPLKTVSQFISTIIGDGGPSSSTHYDIYFGLNLQLSQYLRKHCQIDSAQGTGPNSLDKVTMLANEVQIPGVSMTSQDVRSVNKGINMKPAMAKVYNEMDMSFILDVDSMPYRFWRGWQDYILGGYDFKAYGGSDAFDNSNTNTVRKAFATQWYDDYTCDIYVHKYEKEIGALGKQGNRGLLVPDANRIYEPFRIKLVNAYPYMLSSIPYSSAASQAVKLSVGVYYEYAQFIDVRQFI